MFRIKRTKHMPPSPMDALIGKPLPSVHYAVLVDSSGGVVSWSLDPALAAEFTADVVARVRQHYANRPFAGQLAFESTAPPEPPPELPPLPELTPEPVPTPEPEPEPEPETEHKKPGRKSRSHATEE